MVGADGVALRDERNKVRYGAPLIDFADSQARNRFNPAVLDALRLTHPEVFAEDGAS
jgi:hypothetical protein